MVSPGQNFRSVWTAAFYNRLTEFMERSSKVTISGPGYASNSKGGITISLPRTKAGGGAATTAPAPWVPFITVVAGVSKANFYPGTIAGLIPSNMFTPLSLTASVVNYVYAQVTATAGVVTGATLAVSTTYPTAPAPATSGTPPTTFNIPIAIFDLSQTPSVASNIVGFGNIWAQPFVTILDTINTGALLTAPFTPWFSWQWGAGNV